MEVKDIAKIFGISEEELTKLFGSSPHIYKIKPVVIFDKPVYFQENEFMNIPPEKTAKSYRYVIQLHVRGASVTDRTPILIKDRNGNVDVIPIQELFTYSEREKDRIVEKQITGLYTWTKDGWKEIKYVMRHKQRSKVKRVLTWEGLIEVTDDHSLFKNDKPIPVSELEVGDEIDHIDLPHIFGDKDVDKGLAWLYGLYLAEGNSHRHGIKITNTNLELLKMAKEIAEKYGYKTHIFEDHERNLFHSICYKLAINLDIGGIFETSGVHTHKERKCRWKKVPSCVWQWNIPSQKAFLEGYLAGDGICIDYRRGYIEWASSSQTVAQGILLLAKNVFNFKYFRVQYQGDVIRVSLAKKHNLLVRKRNEIRKIIEAKDNLNYGEKNANYKHGRYKKFPEPDEFIYSRKRWVYDIETESHDFLAGVGRIRAHNSCHGDLRLEREDDLIGWTLLMQIEGYPKEPITTLKEAKEFFEKYKSEAFKIDFETGEFKYRTDKAGRKRKLEIQVVPKKSEPIIWLFNENLVEVNQFDYFVEGVAPIGTPGSTANYPGVFLIIDKGYVEYGAVKPYFFEYFFNSGILKGRHIIRTLTHEEFKEVLPPAEAPEEEEIRSKHFFVMIQPEEQLPYVLSARAVETGYIPPYKYSALPEYIRKNIPEKYQYWKYKDKKKRIELRDYLVKNYEELHIDLKKLVKMEENEDFGIWRIWWKRETKEGKPVIVVRWGPSTQYYLMKVGDKVFESLYNPMETFTFLYPRRVKTDLMSIKSKTKLEPKTELNPTKATACYIEPIILDKVQIFESSPEFIKFEYKNELYVVKKQPKEDFWLFEKSEKPKTVKS